MQGPINLGKVMHEHATFRRAHASLVDKELERAGKFGVNYVHLHPTFKKRTGKLQKETRYRIVRLRSGAIVRLENPVKYAKAIDQGSKRHLIAAKRARALRFTWKGVLMFRRYVIHPGNRPLKFLYRATSATGRVFETSMRSGMNRIAKEF
jgi:hypothetical protein